MVCFGGCWWRWWWGLYWGGRRKAWRLVAVLEAVVVAGTEAAETHASAEEGDFSSCPLVVFCSDWVWVWVWVSDLVVEEVAS